ncbi:CusA/CzcA family heavy metal efflux RND transporter [Pseudoalteromonas shioyasakiensis]|uniref:CusA/CzcA family heavy metal efflux RND transporter n=1 Tax=Pseudoalteromonas shioyasakiensis TaxID=1190813 RepID=A0ABT6TXK6_9GAMM|nr:MULTISPECIES: CusA/CzcA family heavy metal efflux RND transporter [Pseudoalteromonas]MDI4668649.1 CusA/CzcA family heavy metal efflux RND transporter [Pseudoalteromonas shioyasakiensis]MDI4673774.1 CusA/CzcA family heavy metal efflux RND transporter [Pseudoalteromonas shioyasakiensis]MDI4685677.1 CusA/CzcA family heavy metal efflux RND transporter [Pseudoalteromonas shioyasakiensis]MDI4703851.1 CusA/CzcA family heavy metal efflux RND transporter [Pseudoalteromonas shioyasakiensis]NUJ20896.1
MFNLLIEAVIKNRLLVLLALLAAIAVSAFMIPKLNLDAFPDVTNVQVAVNTEAPGLAAEEVEQLITYPIEAVMYALPDVEQVRSISKTGLSGVTVVFKEGVDIYFARQLVFERLQSAKELIPDGVGMPTMGPNTSGLGQVYQYLLEAKPDANIDSMALRSLNDWVVKLLILPIDGVTDILSFGGEVKQYQVNINPNKLLAYDLTQQDVSDALDANNSNVGGWYMNRGQEQLVIRGTGWFTPGDKGLAEIAQTPIKTIDGTVVKVADVANVELGSEIRQGAVTLSKRDEQGEIVNRGEVVTGIVLKRMGANTKQTIDGINARIEMINQALPKGVEFKAIYDQAELISQAVQTVIDALLLAFVFIIIVLALFLLDFRATFLVLLSIPISIGLALSVMAWLGLSANLMSLGGIAVAIGMLVDGSVVMVENVFRHLGLKHNQHKPSSQLVAIAAKEVARPIFFASLIILTVFLPLFSFEGVEAKLFQPMAVSIILAIISAVIVALVVVPALCVYLFAKGVTVKQSILLKPIDMLYQRALQKALQAKRSVLAIAGLLLIVAAVILPRLGTEFVPELEEGTINLRVTLAPSASLDTAISVAPKLEAMLLEFSEVEYALSRIGRAEVGGDPEPVNNIEIYLGLKSHEQWVNAKTRVELQQLMEAKLEQFPGLLFNFSQPIATRVDELLSGVKAQLAIKLFGSDLGVLTEKGQQIEQLVQQIPGAKDVAMEQIGGEAQLIVKPNRLALSRFGLSVADLMDVVQHGIGGQSAGQIINANERYDIYVRIAKSFRQNPNVIADLRLQTPTGAIVRVGDVADVQIESGAAQVRRDDVQRRVVIQANVQGRDMGSVVADIRATIADKMQLPSGYSVAIGGQFENQQRAQQRLMIVVPVALLLIALLLYFAFSNLSQVVLILVNVPLAVIGGVVALYVSGQYLSVPSSVGFITLFGVAVLNGVVMVESINQRISAGDSKDKAVFEGAVSRLRPVLMTALTSMLGLIPMLLSTGIGAEIQKPLATVIVGGLVSATFLTLFVLPVLYKSMSK